MKLRPGLKLQSPVTETQLVVVRAPDAEVELAAGGVPLAEDGAEPAGGPSTGVGLDASGEGPKLGKRYADDELGLELLCTRAGEGALTVDGRPLLEKGAKPLPSSD